MNGLLFSAIGGQPAASAADFAWTLRWGSIGAQLGEQFAEVAFTRTVRRCFRRKGEFKVLLA